MRLDLADLRLFVQIVEAGSITHGARRSNLSLAAASERLLGMEAACGVRLLERRHRGVVPTAAGETLAHHARVVSRQIDQMRGELGGYAHGLRGSIRILANTAAISEFLPKALASYLALHPHVDVELRERQSIETVKAVAAGLADIGIISDAVDAGSLRLLPFALDRLVLVMPADHPLAGARRVSLDDVTSHAFIGLSEGSALQDHIGEYAQRGGRPLKFRARVQTFEGICEIVAGGGGIGIVSQTAAQRCRRSLPIRIVRLTDAWATRRLSVCVRDIDTLPPLAQDLVRYLGNDAKSSPILAQYGS